MDLSTIIGFVVGFGLIGWSVYEGTDGNFMVFVCPRELAIVLGGATAATLISFPLRAVLATGKILLQAFFEKSTSASKLIADLVNYAEIARRDGILSLENVAKDIKDEFLVRGIQMAVDGSDPELIERVLSSELGAIQERHEQGRALFETIGKYAPAFGMVGTLIGLVLMFKSMDDPKKIGGGMSIALLCTLYGAVLANLVALPLADKLKIKNSHELLHKEIIIRGVMAIQSGDNPRIVEQKLRTFLAPRERKTMDAEGAAKAA